MLSLLLAATAPAGEETLFVRFGIEPVYLVMQVISFGILAFVLYRYMIKPVVATVDERNAKIESGLKYAEEMKAKLEAAQQETAALLKKSQVDASRIVEEARKTAKEYLDKQTQETALKANDILVKAQQAIELERKKMLADVRTEVARLVVSTTQRVLAKELSDAERTRYNESAAKELSGV